MASKKINAAIITTRPHGNSLEHRDEFEAAQIADDEIVPFELAQIPCVLFATGWTLNRSMSPTMVAQYKEQYKWAASSSAV